MQNTYWNQKGRFQSEFDELCKLMPPSGCCDTVAGELIRSANRLAYDFYNNGMGNNTSGAANFLREKGAIDPETYATIYAYTRGTIYRGHYEGDSLHTAIERAIDMTVEMIIRNPVLITQANTEDQFDYEDEFEQFDEDEYEDDRW